MTDRQSPVDNFVLRNFRLIRTIVVILLGWFLAALVILAISRDRGTTLRSFFLGPLSSRVLIGSLFETMTPLVFTGLALAIQFQAKQFNLGAEGCFFIGAAIGTAFAISTRMPTALHIVCTMAVGAAAGAAWNWLPGYLKAKYGSSELVCSLMLNYVALYLGLYLINYHFRDTAANEMTSYRLPATATLPRILPGTRLHIGFLIALAVAVLFWVFLYRTKWGYQIRMVGSNINFAKANGISTGRVIVLAQVIGGAVAGLGGIIQIMGIDQRFLYESLPGFGFDGIVVTRIALNNPLLVIPSALFLAYLKVGGSYMNLMGDVPAELVNVVEGVIILLISSEALLETWRYRIMMRKASER